MNEISLQKYSFFSIVQNEKHKKICYVCIYRNKLSDSKFTGCLMFAEITFKFTI